MSIPEITYAAIHVRTIQDRRRWADFAVLVVDDGRSTSARTFTQGTRQDILFAALDQLLRTATSPTVLYVNNGRLRDQLADLRDCAALAHVCLSNDPGGPLHEVNSRAQSTAADLIAHTAVADLDCAHSRRIPVIATDASQRLHQSGFGVACVREDGRYRARYVTGGGPIVVGELTAIAVAAETFHHPAITILTDSQDAIRYLRMRPERLDSSARNLVLRVHKVMRFRDVDVRWVRGHNGHLLNETADRLAVAARRNHDAGVDGATAERIFAGIIADLTGGVAAVA